MNNTVLSRIVLAGCLCLPGVTAHATGSADSLSLAPSAQTLDRIASARVPFIRNEGQVANPDVRFYASMFAGTVFVTADNHLVYALPGKDGDSPGLWAFREEFYGALHSEPKGSRKSAVSVSHYKGDNPDLWKQHLETFDSLDLGEIYPGIRSRLKAAGNNVEKIFVVAPGAEVGAIDIAIDGVEGITVNKHNELVLRTRLGDINFTAPIAFQNVDGRRQPVEVAYTTTDTLHYGFRVGPYDRERELVIDPLLASTLIGGHNPQPPGNYDDDIIYGMVAAGGNVYVAGATQSPDFPVQMGYDETLDSEWPDGFVTLMSGDLSTVIASTYFGTDGSDRVTDLALDDAGTVIVIGQAGYEFPVTAGAYTWNGSTPTGGGFVARFSADLSTLLACAVPTPGDYPSNVAVGNNGIYFGGSTNNPSFPITAGAFKTTCCPITGSYGIRESNGFAGKLSMDLTTLESMTYLGGQTVSGIAVGSDSSVYISDGWDYAITGYLARFDAGLTQRPGYLSYYPGSTSGSTRTYFNDVAVGNGVVVTAGETYMNDLPVTPGAFDTTCGTNGLCDGIGPLTVPRSDGFVAVYSTDLQTTIALTYLGGSHFESIRSLKLAPNGDIFVAGETTSVDFPTVGDGADTQCGTDGACNAPDPYSPLKDAFVARLSPDLTELGYGTYLGGSAEDQPLVLALDDAGMAYAAGYTDSADFPTTPGAFDSTYNGGTSDAFISWIDTGASQGIQSLLFADGFESGSMSAWNLP